MVNWPCNAGPHLESTEITEQRHLLNSMGRQVINVRASPRRRSSSSLIDLRAQKGW